MKKITILSGMLFLCGCWDDVVHTYDSGNVCSGTDEDTGTGADTGEDTSSDTASSDTETNTANDSGNTTLPAEWRGFGTPCVTDADCAGYPSENKRCIHNVMNIINAPGGYCTACCNEPGFDVCGPGIDCVGVTNAYLVCLAGCGASSDCREDEFWTCRSIPYINADFPDDYCLPDTDHAAPDTSGPTEDMSCPWPWSTDT